MHEFASINGILYPTLEAAVPVFSAGLLYGKGVFTTIAVVGGKPFLWDKHWKRLRTNAAAVSLDISGIGESQVLESLLETIAANSVVNGRTRITFHDMSFGPVWSDTGENHTAFFIITGDQQRSEGKFRLTIADHILNSASPLVGVKSCNYLENFLVLGKAKSRGFNEAVRVNERGMVAGGCMSNIFWSKNGSLFTPLLKTGCLAGTTREHIIENTKCKEVEAGIDKLRSADAVYMTSAGIGIVEVAELDNITFSEKRSSILSLWPD